MFQSLEVFQMANDMAVHAGKRQALIAENVANADTPGYEARDVVSFYELVQPETGSLQRATRSAHLHGVVEGMRDAPIYEQELSATINGNSVSVEQEMLKAVETKRQHDRALSIYKSALTVLHKVLESR